MRRTPGWLGMTVLSLCLGVPCAAVPAASNPSVHGARTAADAPQVLPVTNAPAGRAASLLRRLFPGARIVDDAKTNTLAVIAAPDMVRAMRAVLVGIDVKNPLAPLTEAIALQRSDPAQPAAKLRTAYPDARIDVAPRRTLIVTSTPQELAQIRELVATIDAPPTASPIASLQPLQTGAVRVTQARASVTLDITPVVNAGNYISVALHPTVNSLTSLVNGVPQIATRDTQTTVALPEDQTLIIGGLIQDSINRTETRVPVLGDLPLVGRAFRNQSLNSSRDELVITVTPHIVTPGENVRFSGPPLPAIPSAQPLPTLPPGGGAPTAAPVAGATRDAVSRRCAASRRAAMNLPSPRSGVKPTMMTPEPPRAAG